MPDLQLGFVASGSNIVSLYEPGNEMSGVTGGYSGNFTTAGIPTYYSNYSIGTKTSSYMEVNIATGLSGRRAQSLVSTTLVDLTPFSKLWVDMEMLTDTSNGQATMGLYSSTSNIDNGLATINVNGVASRATYSLDVSSINSSGYAAIAGATDPAGTAINFRLYRMWLTY